MGEPVPTRSLTVEGSGAVGLRRCPTRSLPVGGPGRLLGGERRSFALDGEIRPFGETRAWSRVEGGETRSCEARTEDGEARPWPDLEGTRDRGSTAVGDPTLDGTTLLRVSESCRR